MLTEAAVLLGLWVVLVAPFLALFYAHGEREREEEDRGDDRSQRQTS